MRQRNALRFFGMAMVATSLACASNSSRDDSAGYQGMSRDTTVRDTTVIRDTTMARDTVRRVGDTTFVQSRDTTAGSTLQRGGNLPDQQIQRRNADTTAAPTSTDTSTTRQDTSSTRPPTSTGTPQR